MILFHINRLWLQLVLNKILCHKPLIKQLIQNYDAPINECNYPVISEKLEWIPNLFVAGCFADLELGPFGRNVMGGRKAAERIEQAFLKLQQYSA